MIYNFISDRLWHQSPTGIIKRIWNFPLLCCGPDEMPTYLTFFHVWKNSTVTVAEPGAFGEMDGGSLKMFCFITSSSISFRFSKFCVLFIYSYFHICFYLYIWAFSPTPFFLTSLARKMVLCFKIHQKCKTVYRNLFFLFSN